MDEEARVKIKGIITKLVKNIREVDARKGVPEFNKSVDMACDVVEVLREINQILLGYRKLPEGKPPLVAVSPQGKEAAQIQRDNDIKWIRGL